MIPQPVSGGNVLMVPYHENLDSPDPEVMPLNFFNDQVPYILEMQHKIARLEDQNIYWNDRFKEARVEITDLKNQVAHLGDNLTSALNEIRTQYDYIDRLLKVIVEKEEVIIEQKKIIKVQTDQLADKDRAIVEQDRVLGDMAREIESLRMRNMRDRVVSGIAGASLFGVALGIYRGISAVVVGRATRRLGIPTQ